MAEFALALVVTFGLTPVVSNLLARGGVLDVPNDRSSHSAPVPRGGGLACTWAVAVAMTLAQLRSTAPPWPASLALLGLAAVGFWDDRRSSSGLARLGLQVAAGAVVGGVTGGTWWWVLLGVACIPTSVNAVNFMDGINGITALNMAVWGITTVAFGSAHEAVALVTVGAVTTGAALGFLPWNAPRARVFLGDSGSYLFGGLVGLGLLLGFQVGLEGLILVAPLSIYLADTGFTMVKRGLRHEPLMTAHRQHIYQRLVAELRLTHLAVALAAAILALMVTAAWASGVFPLGACVTVAVLGAYLLSPRALTRLGPDRIHD